MAKYYDGTKLLSMKDLDGNTPEIFICTSNRSAGKTTYFSRLCVNKWRKGEGKFAIINRYKYELSDCADKFYKDIGTLFFPGTEMTAQPRAGGIFAELYINGEACGYAICLNSADQLKKYGHLLSDVERMFFDEFQSETNHYCPDEIRKFLSVHTTIARGQGKAVRYVPVYMCSNPVSIINPYYTEMGIGERLRDDTRFLRGNGFVLEQGFVAEASEAQKNSGFNKAFARNAYVAYAAECVYLNDNQAFIEKPVGKPHYLCTLRYNGANYAIKEYADLGIIYCDDRPDVTNSNRLSVTTEDHNVNYVMLRRCELFLTMLRNFFEKGCFRFKNLKCKEAVMKALSY